MSETAAEKLGELVSQSSGDYEQPITRKNAEALSEEWVTEAENDGIAKEDLITAANGDLVEYIMEIYAG